jgi:hypothetical protein
LKLPDIVASSGSADRACLILHRTDNILVKQHSVSETQAAFLLKEASICELPSFSHGSRVPTRPAVYQGSPRDTVVFRYTELALRDNGMV